MMDLSSIGELLDYAIQYANMKVDIEIPQYVIMPNHFHAIVQIENTKEKTEEIEKQQIEIDSEEHNKMGALKPKMHPDDNTEKTDFHFNSLLSVVVGGIKSYVTRNIRSANYPLNKIWQQRYHEHVIRNQHELNLICEYIDNNIVKWEEDCFF